MRPSELCDLTEGWAAAPFCAGPSLRECPGGVEVPEDEPCPGNDAVGGLRGWNPCETDGTCDHDEPIEFVVETVEPAPLPVLPATGLMADDWLVISTLIAFIGVIILITVKE